MTQTFRFSAVPLVFITLVACGQSSPGPQGASSTPSNSGFPSGGVQRLEGQTPVGSTFTPSVQSDQLYNCNTWVDRNYGNASCSIYNGRVSVRVKTDCKWDKDTTSPWTPEITSRGETYHLWSGKCFFGVRSVRIELRWLN